jgi:hypothetical protein
VPIRRLLKYSAAVLHKAGKQHCGMKGLSFRTPAWSVRMITSRAIS